jgi:hypothetical protein
MKRVLKFLRYIVMNFLIFYVVFFFFFFLEVVLQKIDNYKDKGNCEKIKGETNLNRG